jgi:hypothetical protein
MKNVNEYIDNIRSKVYYYIHLARITTKQPN